jgi:aerobic-type carbon monoxide dehydrogenase small subunit (CoxS/CutS family)
MSVDITVNGRRYQVRAQPLARLLDVLRDDLGLTGAKAGCQHGSCGTCTVLVDGEPRRSCLTLVAAVDGCEITTVEGLGSLPGLSDVQVAFNEHYAAQCGFCTPGMLLAATALIRRKGRSLSPGEVTEALGGHYCRCTGYTKIIEAVVAASRGERLGTMAPGALVVRSATGPAQGEELRT